VDYPVRSIARDDDSAVGCERDAVRDGSLEPRDQLELARLQVEPVDRRRMALDDPQVAAVGGDRAAVGEVGQLFGEKLQLAVGREPEDAAVPGTPGAGVGDIQRPVGRERRVVRIAEAVLNRPHDPVLEHADERAVGDAEHDAAPAVDR
jgi:hypothetical protein